jgi:hypothetical protein
MTSVDFTADAAGECDFWLNRLLTHNGLAIMNRETQVDVVMWSDASDVGWGGEAAGVTTQVRAAEMTLPSTAVGDMAHGMLDRKEISRSSTRRELVALLHVASSPSILAQIRGKRVRVVMDSAPAICNLLKGGGPVKELCDAVREWTEFCEKNGVTAVYEWVRRTHNWRADQASKLANLQHDFRKERYETKVRYELERDPATQWRKRNNHFQYGRVPIFTPMFHQVDARVEMIRSQLEEAIIVVPRWPAGGTSDWYRRVSENSIASWRMGSVSRWYASRPKTGHDDELVAFWLMGRRGEKRRAAAVQMA